MTPHSICLYILTRPWWARVLLWPVLYLARRAVVRQALASDDGMDDLLDLMAALDVRRRRPR